MREATEIWGCRVDLDFAASNDGGQSSQAPLGTSLVRGPPPTNSMDSRVSFPHVDSIHVDSEEPQAPGITCSNEKLLQLVFDTHNELWM
jgi:hypothetical protein